MVNEQIDNKVAYGDPECSEDCPVRKIHLGFCNLAVYFTSQEIEAFHNGDIKSAVIYEDLQNQFAVRLGCTPATDKI